MIRGPMGNPGDRWTLARSGVVSHPRRTLDGNDRGSVMVGAIRDVGTSILGLFAAVDGTCHTEGARAQLWSDT